VVNQAQSERIEIRCVGGDIVPHNVRASDLAGLLEAAETLIVAGVLREHPELTRDDIIIGLTEVQNKSLGLQFTPWLPQIVIPEFERIAVVIQQRIFDTLPPDARDALRKIATFTRKHRCVTQLRTTRRDAVLVTIDQELVVPIAPRLYVETTIYGYVVNAGGKSPNAHLDTLHGQRVICKGTYNQIKMPAERLYTEVVGVKGRARCDVDTLAIDEFEIDEVLPYEDTSITAAIRELGTSVAPHFDDVNADAYVYALREDSEMVLQTTYLPG
jgi:hypothetical protein